MAASALIPVKAFAAAKVRLAPALDADRRARLARQMATHVVRAAAPLPVSVVCDDAGVREWAESVGARPIWTPGLGLDGAVEAGVAALAEEGVDTVVVAHSDLPLAAGLADLPGRAEASVLLVPDRHGDGTNVAVLPSTSGFRFAYGHGSFVRHVAEAERLGLGPIVHRAADLGWDVDLPADLMLPSTSVLPDDLPDTFATAGSGAVERPCPS